MEYTFTDKVERKLAKLFGFGLEERLVFYEQLMGFMGDGLSASECIVILEDVYKEAQDTRWQVMREARIGISDGKEFGEAMGKWITDSERMMIITGERSGDLVKALEELVMMITRQRALYSAVFSAMAPSAFYILVAYGFILFMAITVIPQFKGVSSPDKWPVFAKMFFGFVDFMSNNAGYIAGSIIALVVLWLKTLPKWAGRSRHFFDKIFPWTVYRKIMTADFLIMVSALLRTGAPMADVFRTLIPHSPNYMVYHMEIMLSNISDGMSDGDIMLTGLFPKDVVLDVKAYGKSSSFSKGIESMGKRIANKTEKSVKATAKVVETFITLFLFAFIIMTLYSSIYALMSGMPGTGVTGMP